ncbi:hypothetical protein GF314_06165 [bacterium]|nr:hypothetical protein [bacterium]
MPGPSIILPAMLVVTLAAAAGPSVSSGIKPPSFREPPPADPALIRQGGDTIADAVPITLPYQGDGTTTGYTDDYDEACPYPQSTSPDVVYTFTAGADLSLDIDLCGSSYDTKVYVYDDQMNLIACNDDHYTGEPCGQYVSRIETMPVTGGVTYFLIIDGYGGDSGQYELWVGEDPWCVIECPAGAELEGEPPLVDGYEDHHNAGCQLPEYGINFGTITQPVFCGVNGWYGFQGTTVRDNDYFELVVPPSGVIEITADAEEPTYVVHLAPPDCDTFVFADQIEVGPCVPRTMTIAGEPDEIVWLFVMAVGFTGPAGGYDYVIESNLGAVAREHRSWSTVKALF